MSTGFCRYVTFVFVFSQAEGNCQCSSSIARPIARRLVTLPLYFIKTVSDRLRSEWYWEWFAGCRRRSIYLVRGQTSLSFFLLYSLNLLRIVCAALRIKYKEPKDIFHESSIEVKEPFHLFRKWFDEACSTPEIIEPNAMCLATATRFGGFCLPNW